MAEVAERPSSIRGSYTPTGVPPYGGHICFGTGLNRDPQILLNPHSDPLCHLEQHWTTPCGQLNRVLSAWQENNMIMKTDSCTATLMGKK